MRLSRSPAALVISALLSASLATTASAQTSAPKAPVEGTTTAQATPASAKGRLSVKEKSGKAVRVLVDGVDVGPAPWTGEVDAGAHEVTLRAPGFGAAPQRVTVDMGKAQEVELTATSQSAPVKIATSDGKGLIYVDGQLVSEGSFAGDLAAGTHRLKITREGYDPFEEELVVKDKEPLARTITLKLSSTITTGQATEDAERLEGVYGGFGLLGLLTPGGTHSSMQKRCDDKGSAPNLVSCDAPGGLGGGLSGFVGYHWDPVGIELYASGSYDERTLKEDWNAPSTYPGLGPDPARLEEYNVRRVGGLGLARVRVEWQSKRLRLSFVGGAGISYRVLSLARVTTSKANTALRNAFVSDRPGYVSPVIELEPSVMLRLTKGVAVSLGLQLLFENPSNFLNGDETPSTKSSATQNLGGSTQGLTTPSYELASQTQIFVGPVLGMMFGP
jgi:hypothetical protein